MKRNFVREAVQKLNAYQPEPQEAAAVLNANENPYNLPKDVREKISESLLDLDYNRYPDPDSTELKKAFSEMTGVAEDQIIVGNGLDEILSILTDTFVEPGETVVSHSPGFAMYKVWTDVADGNYVEVEDLEDHQINVNGLVSEAIRNNAKLVFVCSPNNPTGQTIDLQEVEELVEATPSIVVLDEAYADFDGCTFIDLINNYDNLIVLRTMSKAFRIPAARVGFASGPKELIDAMKKVKAPYNVDSLSQDVAKIVIENRDELEPAIEEIKNQREDMYDFLSSIEDIETLPSAANFLYITTPKHKELNEAFINNEVLVRYFPKEQSFRITIGTPKENKLVKESIEEVFNA